MTEMHGRRDPQEAVGTLLHAGLQESFARGRGEDGRGTRVRRGGRDRAEGDPLDHAGLQRRSVGRRRPAPPPEVGFGPVQDEQVASVGVQPSNGEVGPGEVPEHAVDHVEDRAP